MEAAKKILIVEDHNDMLMILKKYLNENKYETIGAENAELGLQLFDSEKPDLVLMDLMLPGMSGLEAISRIKAKEQDGHYTPIIVLTAKNEVNDIVTGLESGADDYIVKPFNFDELIARIRTALRLRDLNDMLLNQSTQLEDANYQVNQLNQSLVTKNKELRRSIYNLHSLFEISIELNSILQLKRLINSILLTIIGQFSCKSALFLYAQKPHYDRFEVMNTKGLYEEDVKDLDIQKNDPLIKYFHSSHYPAQLKDLIKKVKDSKAIAALGGLGIQLIAPTVIQGKVEGLVCFGPRVKDKNYVQHDIEHISILNSIISISVSNASLYQEVEQLSYTDAMTELHNFRYFELRLKEEVVRHKRTKSGLSLLILDVDHFKNYNDTLGHPAGDDVLRRLGQILKDTIRENDIAARYGGEEFAVILPAVHKDGALVLADRIRENIEQSYFEEQEIQPLGKITVSVGVASMPEDTEDYKELITFSDEALYEAKNNGRNRVCLYRKAKNKSKT